VLLGATAAGSSSVEAVARRTLIANAAATGESAASSPARVTVRWSTASAGWSGTEAAWRVVRQWTVSGAGDGAASAWLRRVTQPVAQASGFSSMVLLWGGSIAATAAGGAAALVQLRRLAGCDGTLVGLAITGASPHCIRGFLVSADGAAQATSAAELLRRLAGISLGKGTALAFAVPPRTPSRAELIGTCEPASYLTGTYDTMIRLDGAYD
jgi:hypothetical protein